MNSCSALLPGKLRAGSLIAQQIWLNRQFSWGFSMTCHAIWFPRQSTCAMIPCSIKVLVSFCARLIILEAFSMSSSLVIIFLATPCSMAFSPTAAASRGKNLPFIHRRQDRVFSKPIAFLAPGNSSAAAMHISSVMVFAATSMTPRNMAGKPKRIVHLIGKIGSSGRDNSRAGFSCLPRPYFRNRIRARKNDCVFGHGCNPLRLDDPGPDFASAIQTSAPFIASAMPPVLLFAIGQFTDAPLEFIIRAFSDHPWLCEGFPRYRPQSCFRRENRPRSRFL